MQVINMLDHAEFCANVICDNTVLSVCWSVSPSVIFRCSIKMAKHHQPLSPAANCDDYYSSFLAPKVFAINQSTSTKYTWARKMHSFQPICWNVAFPTKLISLMVIINNHTA